MKKNILYFLAVGSFFFGLMNYINFNRNSAEKKKTEIERIDERKKFVQDSLKLENKKQENLTRIELEKIATAERIELKKIATANKIESERIATSKRIDGYTNKTNTKFDVAVLITDDTGEKSNEISTKISAIYKDQNYSVTNSLFTTSFIQSKYLLELQNSNSQVIDMLKLKLKTNYVVIGKINYSFDKGTSVEGTTICTAKINITIISVNQNSIKNAFSFPEYGYGLNEAQAKNSTLQTLLEKYSKEYSTI